MPTYTLASFHYNVSTKSFAKRSADRALGPLEALIKTTHASICFTDVHAKNRECEPGQECGLGHEGVGKVIRVGAGFTNLKIGDRVGWGWLHSSCGHCPSCTDGYRQYCAEARGFAFSDLDQGALGDYRIINAAFCYRIPDAISSLHAGPFMCAGASVYEALQAASIKSSDRVGVVGIGGLGHMAILFAKAMGCGVTALSSNSSKTQDAFALGADELRQIPGKLFRQDETGQIIQESEDDSVPQHPINVLLICSNEVPDMGTVLPLLARRATIVLMTIQQQPLVIPYMPFILPGHKLVASTEASQRNHIDMLEFAARHHIEPWIEKFPMTETGIKEAFDRLESGHMKYRGVLEVQ